MRIERRQHRVARVPRTELAVQLQAAATSHRGAHRKRKRGAEADVIGTQLHVLIAAHITSHALQVDPAVLDAQLVDAERRWRRRRSRGWRRRRAASAKRSEEHTSELQSLMRISYAVFCLKNKQQAHTKQ